MDSLFINFLGNLRALHLWFHAAHNLSKGSGFAGDHLHIYGEIYTKAVDQWDDGVEKIIGLTNNESFGCPVQTTVLALQNLQAYPSPVDQDDLTIASTAYSFIRDFILHLEKLNAELEKTGFLTLGLQDYLSSLANEYENYFYHLQQRIKVTIEQ